MEGAHPVIRRRYQDFAQLPPQMGVIASYAFARGLHVGLRHQGRPVNELPAPLKDVDANRFPESLREKAWEAAYAMLVEYGLDLAVDFALQGDEHYERLTPSQGLLGLSPLYHSTFVLAAGLAMFHLRP